MPSKTRNFFEINKPTRDRTLRHSNRNSDQTNKLSIEHRKKHAGIIKNVLKLKNTIEHIYIFNLTQRKIKRFRIYENNALFIKFVS